MEKEIKTNQWDEDTELAEELMKQKVWAVVGANHSPHKYGNMIYNKLLRHDYQVYPVNRRYDTINDNKCYPTISDLPVKPEVINMVVAPAICENYLHEAAELGIKYIWLQPGTHDEKVMDLIDKYELKAVQACILVSLR